MSLGRFMLNALVECIDFFIYIFGNIFTGFIELFGFYLGKFGRSLILLGIDACISHEFHRHSAVGKESGKKNIPLKFAPFGEIFGENRVKVVNILFK